MKKCSKCKKPKQLSEFYKSKSRKDGHQVWCKKCAVRERIAYYKTHRDQELKRNKAWKRSRIKQMWNYLKEHSCVDCGEKDYIVLEFDHVRGNKINAVTTLVRDGRPWSIVEQEIEKCEVRCANCHRRRHWTKRD